MRTLQAGDLMLEPQVATHAAELYPLLADPEMSRYLDTEPPSDPTWLVERFAKLETRLSADGRAHWLNWVVSAPAQVPAGHAPGQALAGRATGRPLIGYVQATVCPNGTAYVAYELGRAFWGRGWATQATAAMLTELADHYAVQRAMATVDKRNLRSIRLLQRLAFSAVPSEAHPQHDVSEGDWLFQRDPLFSA